MIQETLKDIDAQISEYNEKKKDSESFMSELFYPLTRRVELALKGDYNILVVEGPGGHGKSFAVNDALKKLDVEFEVITGKVTDAKLFELLYTYNEQKKVIIFRDISRILSSVNCVEMLKAFTDTTSGRSVNCHSFGVSMKDTPDTFIAQVPLIFETNKIKETKELKEHLEALGSRGEFFYWALSNADLTQVMNWIAIEDWQKECTNFLLSKKREVSKRLFTLRMQDKAFSIYKAAVRDDKDWKTEIDLMLKNSMNTNEKLLYEFAGNEKVKKSDFCKFIARRSGLTLRRSQQMIKEAILMDDFSKEGKHIRLNRE